MMTGAPDRAPLKYARLALSFDSAALAREVAALPDGTWVAHFNQGYHDGGWTGAALRAPGGDAQRLYPDPNDTGNCADTPLRAASPLVDAALATFGPALHSARLLRLAPGGCIREHRDYGLFLESGEARLHVPITTGPGVEFYLDGELVPMEPGECWYLNFDLPHRVQNLGTVERVHLVIDCGVTDWLLTQFPGPDALSDQQELIRQRTARVNVAQQRLERFCTDVLADPAVLSELVIEPDRERFIARVVDAGLARGMHFTVEDVRAAMDASRRAWIERWIVR